MRLPSIVREVPEGGLIPRGFGIAWYQPGRAVATALPIPVHLIAGLLHVLWWHVRCPPWRFVAWRIAYMSERIRKLDEMLLAWAEESTEAERAYFGRAEQQHTTATDRLLAEAHRLRRMRG